MTCSKISIQKVSDNCIKSCIKSNFFFLRVTTNSGLFRRAMIMSGSPIAFWGLAAPHWKPGYNIAEYCDRELCPRNRDPQVFRDYLMKLPWQTFTKHEVIPIPTDVSEGHPDRIRVFFLLIQTMFKLGYLYCFFWILILYCKKVNIEF